MAALGLSFGAQDLSHFYFLAATCSIFSCGMWTLSCSLRYLVPYQDGTQAPSHWTTEEVPICFFLMQNGTFWGRDYIATCWEGYLYFMASIPCLRRASGHLKGNHHPLWESYLGCLLSYRSYHKVHRGRNHLQPRRKGTVGPSVVRHRALNNTYQRI